MTNPVVWFEIYVNDLARAQKFYEEVFQIQLTELPNPTGDGAQMMMFPGDEEGSKMGASGALVYMEGVQAGGNSTLVYFASKDCAIEQNRVIDAGGRIQQPKFSIGPHGFISLCIDTEGNMFGIHTPASTM